MEKSFMKWAPAGNKELVMVLTSQKIVVMTAPLLPVITKLALLQFWGPLCNLENNVNGLVQERCNSIANAMELCLSYTNPSIPSA